jgi:predicted ribosomally synthesized peptide with nif11-like leader
MSVEQAKAFIEKLDSDKAFLTQVAGAGSDEARLELAKAAGFEFTAEELAGVIDQFTDEELSEDELDAVAGGRGYLKGEIIPKKLSSKFTEVEWTYIDKSSPDLM